MNHEKEKKRKREKDIQYENGAQCGRSIRLYRHDSRRIYPGLLLG